jgi:ABC-type multidrug transport system fused ATPase/permease subunit
MVFPDGNRLALARGLLAPYHARLAAGLGCLVVLAVAQAGYAYVTGPLLQLMLTGGQRGSLLDIFSTRGATSGSVGGLWVLAAILVGLALIKGLAHLGQSMLLDGTAERIGADLRVQFYAHVLRLPLANQREHALGDLLARLIDDVRRVQDGTVLAPIALVREGLGVFALLGIAVWMAPLLALAAVVSLPLVALVIQGFGKLSKQASAYGQAEFGQMFARATQGLQAAREVKSAGAEDHEIRSLKRHSDRAVGFTLRGIFLRAISPGVNEVTAAIALSATLLLASVSIARGSLPAERLISFFTAVLLMYKPIKELGRAMHAIAGSEASWARVVALLKRPEEEACTLSEALQPLRQEMELRGVSFCYADGKWALRDIDLCLPLGKIVALSGSSGAGKSSLANIVCGLERPTRGALLWDGQDLEATPLPLRRARVALVPQQPLLFHATVAENLRYGSPEASEEDLRWAVAAAGLESCLRRLTRGLDTRIGPGGIELSVGEVQRLALARALLRRANLLVLDEPSSALDDQNEAILIRTLHVLKRTKAVLIIAHGRALLDASDEVITLREGRIDMGPAALPDKVRVSQEHASC